MQAAAVLLILFVAACSASSGPPPAPASDEVDPYRELVEVPDELCPQIAGWLAMTPRAVRLMLDRDVERERAFRTELARAQTTQRVAEARAQAAISAAEQADWWSRWGVLVGGSIGVAGGAVIGAVLGFLGGKIK